MNDATDARVEAPEVPRTAAQASIAALQGTLELAIEVMRMAHPELAVSSPGPWSSPPTWYAKSAVTVAEALQITLSEYRRAIAAERDTR